MQQRGIGDSHPSVAASMDDFEDPDFSPTLTSTPLQRSTHRSNAGDSSSSSDSPRSFSPPAWRKAGSGWFKHQPSLSPVRHGSKESSPDYHSAGGSQFGDGEEDETTCIDAYPGAAKIPLPESPTYGRSPSPTPDPANTAVDSRVNPFAGTPPRLSPEMEESTPRQTNYIRFSTSLDVMQRTEPIEAAVSCVSNAIKQARSKTYSIASFLVAMLALTAMFNMASKQQDMPDLVKVAQIAQSLEPAIYYSQHGYKQIDGLHSTGIAVWDLSESVRTSNMTSASIIYEQLYELGQSIKSLCDDMTTFFGMVDGDIDNILYAMAWAQQELQTIDERPLGTLSSTWSGMQTTLGAVVGQSIMGQTHSQKAQAKLEVAFTDLLNAFEESIDNEISSSLNLFRQFEIIDNQFTNVRRSTTREEDSQERQQNEILSSLWTRLLGANAHRVHKFEQNRALLASVRDRTLQNKHTLSEHNQRLLVLKNNLEQLRRRIMAPLLRSQNTTQSIASQINGLDNTYQSLKLMREAQRRRVNELVMVEKNDKAKGIGDGS